MLRMGFNAGDRWSSQSSFIVCVWGGGFTANPDCFQCSSLPEATCCPVALYSLPFNAVVGGMGMHSYSMHSSARYFLVTACLCSDTLIFRVLLVSPMYILYIYVYLVAVPARDLVCHFLLLLFRGLLFHSHKQLFQGVLA